MAMLEASGEFNEAVKAFIRKTTKSAEKNSVFSKK
jgi:hypothetical protein